MNKIFTRLRTDGVCILYPVLSTLPPLSISFSLSLSVSKKSFEMESRRWIGLTDDKNIALGKDLVAAGPK